MKKLLKKYWYVLMIIIILPIGLNFALRLNTTNSIIGNSETWLAFWSTYSASLIGSLITLYVLFKTLKQNEANNEASKKLQITIYQKGIEERRLQELGKTFKESLQLIDFTQVRYNQSLIVNKNYTEAETFFHKELTRSMDTLNTYALDFISINMDEKLQEYLNNYKEIIFQYCKLMQLITRTLINIKTQSLEEKKNEFQEMYDADKKKKKSFSKDNLIFSDTDYSKIFNSEDEHKFNYELITVMNNQINKFAEFYGKTQKILMRKSIEITSEKVKKLETLSTI